MSRRTAPVRKRAKALVWPSRVGLTPSQKRRAHRRDRREARQIVRRAWLLEDAA